MKMPKNTRAEKSIKRENKSNKLRRKESKKKTKFKKTCPSCGKPKNKKAKFCKECSHGVPLPIVVKSDKVSSKELTDETVSTALQQK